jgi:hypothetical protein
MWDVLEDKGCRGLVLSCYNTDQHVPHVEDKGCRGLVLSCYNTDQHVPHVEDKGCRGLVLSCYLILHMWDVLVGIIT